MSATYETAIVTGAGRGFGRAVAAALAASGTRVVGVARDAGDLEAAGAGLGGRFVPVAGDATGEGLAADLIRAHRPGLLVLAAGVSPAMAPLQEQTWEGFGLAWENDTRHVFTWLKAALLEPLPPGSAVVAFSSGAALSGSPMSGGYAGAKATIRFLRGYAAAESDRAGLGIRFHTVLPRLTPLTGLGAAAVAGYAAREGVTPEEYAQRFAPPLTPEQVGEAVLEIATDPGAAAEYLVTGSGTRPLG